jgi:lauroyl/myristoyl acyltransferase
MGVPVLFLSCLRAGEPLTYKIDLTRLLAPEELRHLSAVEIATRINREMESMILEQPDQYLWFHDRYRRASMEPST